jgi:hypothetical protein
MLESLWHSFTQNFCLGITDKNSRRIILLIDVKILFEIRDIEEKADTWWISEVEIPINPDFDQVEVKDSDIKLGRMIILDHLISVALAFPPVSEGDKSDLVH